MFPSSCHPRCAIGWRSGSRKKPDMALTITDECINCDVCEPECPNDAISMGEAFYEIAPDRCTECVGHFDEPQCVQICPVACIPVHPDFVESKESLWAKYRRLQAEAGKPAFDQA